MDGKALESDRDGNDGRDALHSIASNRVLCLRRISGLIRRQVLPELLNDLGLGCGCFGAERSRPSPKVKPSSARSRLCSRSNVDNVDAICSLEITCKQCDVLGVKKFTVRVVNP